MCSSRVKRKREIHGRRRREGRIDGVSVDAPESAFAQHGCIGVAAASHAIVTDQPLAPERKLDKGGRTIVSSARSDRLGTRCYG